MPNPLTPDEIAALRTKKTLSAEEAKNVRSKATRKPASKSKKIDTTDRSYNMWFRLRHYYGRCENPECLSPEGPARMVSEVNGTMMCRWDYLNGWEGNGDS